MEISEPNCGTCRHWSIGNRVGVFLSGKCTVDNRHRRPKEMYGCRAWQPLNGKQIRQRVFEQFNNNNFGTHL